jgi:hypothetical protein
MDNWVRFNPDENLFDIAKVIGQIHLRIYNLTPIETKIVEHYIEVKPRILSNEERAEIIANKHIAQARKNIDLLPEKPCNYCGVTKALEEFNNAKDHRDGKENICKVCKREKDRLRNEKYREENPLPLEKLCKECKNTKPLEDFYRDKKTRDGRERMCKECHNYRIKAPATKIEISEKKCTRCNVIKPITKFHKQSSSRDGHKIYCADCCKEEYRTKQKSLAENLV